MFSAHGRHDGAPAMTQGSIKSIVIVGGGAAGWMTALALSRMAPPALRSVVLVESPEIGTIGVGEATLPTIRSFNAWAGLDEAAIVRDSHATFKLGIEFRGWRGDGGAFFHGFGDYGPDIAGLAPYHQIVRLGLAGSLGDFSLPTVAARVGRFAPPAGREGTLAASYSYAYHFDAGLYAAHLREVAIAAGTLHVQGRVDHVAVNGESGLIENVRLDDGRTIAGDLFIDCSGFRALLIGGALGAAFEDWSHWLPTDRAWVVPCAGGGEITPFTRATATTAGWRWRIPLQHRIGNGQVYASGFQDDEAALSNLLAGLEGAPFAEPRLLRFRAGHRRRFWSGNCVAIGLSGGFLEPLESTSIHLIERGIGFLIERFPSTGFDPALARDYDRLMTQAFASIRDFIILHYRLNRRTEPFWRMMRDQPIPDALAHQIELFVETGEIAINDPRSFAAPSWAAILFGMGLVPRHYHPLADREPREAVAAHLGRGCRMIADLVAAMPSHRRFVSRFAGEGA